MASFDVDLLAGEDWKIVSNNPCKFSHKNNATVLIKEGAQANVHGIAVKKGVEYQSKGELYAKIKMPSSVRVVVINARSV